MQILNDSNLKCLLDLFAFKTTSNKMNNLTKLWSKLCRLGANLCHEKVSHKIKEVFTLGILIIYNNY